MKAGTFRHRVSVLLPPTVGDEHGQPRGADTVYIHDVPCSIETLSGREGEIARQNFAEATTLVKCYADPGRPIKEFMRLQFGKRLLEVGFVKDAENTGVMYELLCGEIVSG